MVLSTSTLNLRFMQNARPVHVAQDHHIKDDAHWELFESPPAYRGEKAVTYETSYLPFLFPSLHDTPAADGPSSLSPSNTLRPRGRRIFNKRGLEITQQASSTPTDTAPQQNIVQPEQSKKSRPHSISSSGVPAPTARHSKKSCNEPSKLAKNLIFDTSGVGSNLRTPFLRPAGIDPPAKTASHSSTGAITSNVKRPRTSAEAREPKKKTRLTLIE